jgi:hypothetical protein
MAATQYYVFAVNTSTGDSYVVTTNANYGNGVKVGGPYSTKAAAQAFISNGGAAKGLSNTVLKQDKGSVGDWIVVPEGEAGDIVNALSLATKNPLGDLVGELKGNLNTGSGTTYTVVQLTTAQQVENAQTANLVLYPTKTAAQAAANTTNAANNPSQGVGWQQELANFLHAIDSSATWVRIAKVVIGGTLVVVGLARMSGTDKAVATAAKDAIL